MSVSLLYMAVHKFPYLFPAFKGCIFCSNYGTIPGRRNVVEYNIHQDRLWQETGKVLGQYLTILAKVETNPRSYVIVPTQIPFNSQKPEYREQFNAGLDEGFSGELIYSNYQISHWYPFSWRYKVKVKQKDGKERLCFLYGDNVRRRLLFGDVTKESLTMIEEVIMTEFFNLPLDHIEGDDYADRIASDLMEPLAAKTITIDHLHRYSDNRLRFDLVFDDMRYHLICSVREISEKRVLPELTIFIED